MSANGHRFAAWRTKGRPPTVIFETGLGAEAVEWQPVVDALPPGTATFFYDRLNRGDSDSVAGARTSEAMATDLAAVLEAAGAAPPFVVVGHSFGAHVAMAFAGSTGVDVSAVVLVDPTHPRQFDTFGPMMPDGEMKQFWTAGWRRTDSTPEQIDFPASFEVTESVNLGSVPLTVLLADSTMGPGVPPPVRQMWIDLGREWTGKSDRADLRVVAGSGHFIQRDEPGAVADALRDVLTDGG